MRGQRSGQLRRANSDTVRDRFVDRSKVKEEAAMSRIAPPSGRLVPGKRTSSPHFSLMPAVIKTSRRDWGCQEQIAQDLDVEGPTSDKG